MHILVSTTTASDLAETAEQSIDYLQKIVDYMISKAHILVSALIILDRWLVSDQVYLQTGAPFSGQNTTGCQCHKFYQFTNQIRITRIARHHCDQ